MGVAAIAACSGGSLNQTVPSAAVSSGQTAQGLDSHSRPMFVVLPYKGQISNIHKPGSLTTWNGSFVYNNHTYNYAMVGTNPATTNSTTTIAVKVIPLKIIIGKKRFSPSMKVSDGKTVLQNTLASPLFKSEVDFNQGGTDLGKTQYEDAFQRGNFWSSVQTNTGYHVLLAPKTLKPMTLRPPASVGKLGSQFGITVGLVDINWIDTQLQSIIKQLKIPPNELPLFEVSDVYETIYGGCCVGGYHSYNGTNTYSIATYFTVVGAFSQDVSAMSHELGEWYDDPFTNNNVACGILEVGDPLEGNYNYGGYKYTVNGFTYNLQDLVFLPYFGAPPSTSVNGWSTFQGEKLSVCQNGG
jgi:hypothetical protein